MLNPNIHPLKKVSTPNVVCKSLNPAIHPVKTVSGKKVNVANECNVIRRTFGINNVSQFACASCHRKILEQH